MPTSRFQGGKADTSVPPISTRPLSAWLKPAMRRSSVVLPQPDGPRKAKNSPGRDLDVDVLEDAVRAVGEVDALDPNAGSAGRVAGAALTPRPLRRLRSMRRCEARVPSATIATAITPSAAPGPRPPPTA